MKKIKNEKKNNINNMKGKEKMKNNPLMSNRKKLETIRYEVWDTRASLTDIENAFNSYVLEKSNLDISSIHYSARIMYGESTAIVYIPRKGNESAFDLFKFILEKNNMFCYNPETENYNPYSTQGKPFVAKIEVY